MVDQDKILTRINYVVIALSVFTVVIVFIGFGARRSVSSEVVAVKPLSTAVAKQTLDAVVNEYWNWTLSNYPEYASFLGSRMGSSLLTDLSLSAIANRYEEEMSFLNRAEASELVNAVLESEDRITLQMLISSLRNNIEAYSYKTYLYVMNQLEGPQLDLADVFAQYMPLTKLEDFDAYVQRLQAIPLYLRQIGDLLREAVKQNRTFPRVVLDPVSDQIQLLCTPSGQESPFMKGFDVRPSDVDSTKFAALRAQASKIIHDAVEPAFCTLRTVWVTEYLPNCANAIGISDRVSRGLYQFNIQSHVTLNITADQIHALGLSEVNRIHTAMETIKNQITNNSSMTLQTFNQILRTNTSLYYSSESLYIAMTRDICKRADAQLPKLFKNLPRCPYGVEPMDASRAPSAPAAYYFESDEHCTRPGTYIVNTYDLASRPSYVMPSTALHETVPGHHLQLATAAELEGLPNFRKFASVDAFVEGWALYAETLGYEMGMFNDPYDDYGHLGDEMLRACRLVVDSGMHAKGWSRDQAIAFMLSNSPLSVQDVRAEVDRYIVWPGQALAYKAGQLTISNLKATAIKNLGSNFDIRDFHYAVLRHASIPLQILAEAVQEELGLPTSKEVLPLPN